MELTWPMKLRIAAAAAVGIGLIGILGWPLANSSEPLPAVSLAAGVMSFGGAIILLLLALPVGFIGYFVSWPYGREIGVLAVPAGLSVWAIRSSSMASLMQLNETLPQRRELLALLKWESAYWLAVVAAGFIGVLIAQAVCRKKLKSADAIDSESKDKTDGQKFPGIGLNTGAYINIIIALVGSVLLTQFCTGVVAQDVQMPDKVLGSVVAQPAVGQVVFGVLVSFGLAGFLVKKFLNLGYIWPIMSSSLVIGFVKVAYLKQNVLSHLVQRWPEAFFPHAAASILPIQMVVFGTIGSIAGYWLAIRYNYWRKHG